MKSKISKCVIAYESWSMQCCGDPLTVGKVADLICEKKERYKISFNIDIDYDEEHHGCGANCQLRGLVTRLQTVFVDRYANIKEGTRYNYDPENDFSVIDTDYIDGYEQPESYGKRNVCDAICYIVTLEDVVEREYIDLIDSLPRGRYISIEPGDEGQELFWNEEGDLIGETDYLSIYKGSRKKTIDLTKMPWQNELVRWRTEFIDHIDSGYDEWTNDEWLDWWSRGYCWAKELRKILPSDVQLSYGQISQCKDVLSLRGDKWELNCDGQMVCIYSDMKVKTHEGLYIPKSYIDLTYEESEGENEHRFVVKHSEHHLFVEDRVILSVIGRPACQLGTVIKVNENSIIIKTDRCLDTGEEYSIELICR